MSEEPRKVTCHIRIRSSRVKVIKKVCFLSLKIKTKEGFNTRDKGFRKHKLNILTKKIYWSHSIKSREVCFNKINDYFNVWRDAIPCLTQKNIVDIFCILIICYLIKDFMKKILFRVFLKANYVTSKFII